MKEVAQGRPARGGQGRRRLIALVLVLGGWFLASAARLFYLQVERHEHYLELAERQQQKVVELNPPRGAIYTRDGRELAISGPADSVYAVPAKVADPHATARALARALDLPAGELANRLIAAKASGRGWFSWVKRQVTPQEAAAVAALELPGIALREEAKRFYPQGSLAAQVVGFVGTDAHGLAGLEQTFDEVVSGKGARRVVLRDAGGRVAVDPDLGWRDAESGRDLYLTIDSTLQHLAERELAKSAESFGARTGSAVLLDPWTGAVLAMASYPTFDPNRFNEAPEGARQASAAERKERFKNRVIEDAFEPGSSFKMVTMAAALGADLVDSTDVFDCGMGQVVVYGKLIRDHKKFGLLTLRDVMAKSSNVGAIKVGLKVGDRRLHQQIVDLGFGRKTGVELPGESSGILAPLDKWQPISKAYISFGQGIAVTSIQLATAFAAVANGGKLLQPYLVEAVGRGAEVEVLHDGPVVVRQAMSASTARQVERLLEAVTLEGGTGTRAAVPGYFVAGKTGTAQMAEKGRYSLTDHMAVFAGFAPGREPLVVGAVMVERPRGDFHGGSVAAPVFGGIMGQALLYLGRRPERDAPEHWPSERAPDDNPVRLASTAAGEVAPELEPLEDEPPFDAGSAVAAPGEAEPAAEAEAQAEGRVE